MDRLTLYRGLGLPKAAIQVYRDYKARADELIAKYGEFHKASADERCKASFNFTTVTSTSCKKEFAIPFAFPATQKEGQVPVLLVMDQPHANTLEF